MAFPVTSVQDTFTGVDTTTPPDGNWTNGLFAWGSGDGLQISGNQVRRNVGTSFTQDAYYNVATFGPDFEVYITVPTISTTNGEGIIVFARCTTIGNGTTTGYGCRCLANGTDMSQWAIYKPGIGTIRNGDADHVGRRRDRLLRSRHNP